MLLKVVLAALVFMLRSNSDGPRIVEAGFVQRGSCPLKPPMDLFSLEKFSGRWYAVGISKPRTLPRKCVQLLISPGEIGTAVINGASYFTTVQRIEDTRRASLARNDPAGLFRFPIELGDGRSTIMELRILDSDYTHYAVMYNCANVTPFFADRLMILSRTPELPEEFESRINEVLLANRLPYLDNIAGIVQDCGEYRCIEDECSYSLLPEGIRVTFDTLTL